MTISRHPPYWVGFDLGGTKMLAAVYDQQFRCLGRERRKTKGHEGEKIGVDRIVSGIRDAVTQAGVDWSEIGGIGVGVPGPVDSDRGIILEAANLGWKRVKLRETLDKTFARPVVVLNDVDAGVYGEYRFGAGKGARSVFGVFPGTGIGGGGVFNGEIIRGRQISCMEIGHLQVVPDGLPCGCGLRGCLETVASRLAIAAEAAKAAYRGEAPYLRKHVGTDISEIRSGALARAIKGGDAAVEQIVRRAARFLGIGMGNVIHLFAPDIIVLGGGMVEAMPELFVSTVQREASLHVMASFRSSFKVVEAKLGDDASVMGAAAWAEKTFAPTEMAEEARPV